MKPKDDKLITTIAADEKQELFELAAKMDVPASQIVREAVREKVAKIKDAEAAEIETAIHPQQA